MTGLDQLAGLQGGALHADHELGDRQRAAAARPTRAPPRRRARRAPAARRRPASRWRGCRRSCRRGGSAGDPTVRAASASAGTQLAQRLVLDLAPRDAGAERAACSRRGRTSTTRSSGTRLRRDHGRAVIGPREAAVPLVDLDHQIGAAGEQRRAGMRGDAGERLVERRRDEHGHVEDCTKRQPSTHESPVVTARADGATLPSRTTRPSTPSSGGGYCGSIARR